MAYPKAALVAVVALILGLLVGWFGGGKVRPLEHIRVGKGTDKPSSVS